MLLKYIKNTDYKEKKIFFISSSFIYQYKISNYVSRGPVELRMKMFKNV